MSNVEDSNKGVSATFLLFLTFLVLKLTDVISWSWWWVTAPLWIPFGLFLAFVVVGFIVALVIAVVKK